MSPLLAARPRPVRIGDLLGRRQDDGMGRFDPRPSSRTAPRPGLRGVLRWVLVLPVLVLVQVTVVSFLPVPGAVPDLVLVTVLGLAHHRGALVGGLVGAWAGLLLDVVPPTTGAFGGWTLVLGTMGCVHGHMVSTRRPGPLLALALMATSAAAATAAHALVLWFSGVPVAPEALVRAALGTAGWALLLAPVALLLTGGRIGTTDPRQRLQSDPTLLDAVTPGWTVTGVAPTGPRPATASGAPTASTGGPAA